MVENTKQGSPAALQESLKKMNSDWGRLKTKVAQRQREFKQTQLEVEQLNALIERDFKLIGELDRVVEKSYHVLEGTEVELEDALRVRKKSRFFKVVWFLSKWPRLKVMALTVSSQWEAIVLQRQKADES